MNISGPFIQRPIATSLLAAAVLLAGGAAYTQLPVAPLPRVDFPTINVNANLPGASPETMAAAVATPLERRFGRIAGISEITSSSGLGSTSLTLQFDLDRDVDAAARDVQAAINAAAGDLPQNLPTRPGWRKVNPADAPILILSLKSKTLQLSQIFDQANTVLAQKIAQVDGVGQVFVGGGQQPAVRVQVDPQAVAALGLSLEDVRAVLANSTSNSPKGALSGQAQVQTLAANDQLLNAEPYKSLIITYKNGAPVRLADVARVFDDVENARVAAWADGERAVLIIIRRQPGANIIEVIDRVKALMPQLASSVSPAIDIQVALDRAQTIRASVRDVESTLLLSVFLVVLVVFVFLRSFRATAIPSVAVPLSLVATFGAMYLLGYSLDNLSLMALTISTGFVVDDAIVVTENVARHVELGKSPREAALIGARQIGFTIVSITVSLLAVFIPLLMMGGVIGRLFREFAVTLSVAIAMSALVSLTLTPMMASRLLRHDTHERGGLKWAERGFNALLHGYGRALKWVLRHRGLTQAVFVGTVALTVYLYGAVPKGLFPQQDTGQSGLSAAAPQDLAVPAMKARQEAANHVVAENKAISHFVSFLGAGPGGGSLNTGSGFIELKPLKERKKSADEVIADLRGPLSKLQGMQVFLQSVQDVRIGGRGARTQYQYTLQDPNLDELKEWAPKVMAKLATLKELKDVATDQQTTGVKLQVDIDRDTAARLGVQPQQVDDTLYDAYGQRQVATLYGPMNQYRVVMEVIPEASSHPELLSKLSVGGAGGAQIPLPAIAKWERQSTSLSINHQGQFPCVTLSFNLAPDVALGTAIAAIHKAEAEIRMPASLHASFQGTAQAFKDSLSSQPLLILFALITVYLVLGVLYESLIHPLTILSTLPSAGVGALLALMATGTDFSIIALIGIILLIGIVKKNAIMMIDFAIEAERDRGLSPHDAILEACLLRFRPILMTTLAALLGGLP
ncbi:MAG: efflux RND transporter permease subunit, partial [Deltaproteobacteria bacterium]|nr:efflux RND transporter permease subunit [Deltaproteobacteria bacterium]